MSLMSPLSIRRLLALGAVVFCCFALLGLWRIASSVGEVMQAQREAAAALVAIEAEVPPDWSSPAPLLRLESNAAQPVEAWLNSELGRFDLLISDVEIASVRPLGEGLRLAEVRFSAAGSVDGMLTMLQWSSVNRDGLRLVSVRLERSPEPGSAPQWATCIWMVVS